MSDRTLVTGFLAFAGMRENPSALLAQSLGRRFQLLEVSYRAVDAWIDGITDQFDILLMLGVRQRGSRIDLERRARNKIGTMPDVDGEIRGPGPIDPAGPPEMVTTLFNEGVSKPLSDDAGCYLCNYVYYRALRSLPAKRVGFVHVPPTDVMSLMEQRRALETLLQTLERPR
jgi:pyroglutamyl-peptidase